MIGSTEYIFKNTQYFHLYYVFQWGFLVKKRELSRSLHYIESHFWKLHFKSKIIFGGIWNIYILLVLLLFKKTCQKVKNDVLKKIEQRFHKNLKKKKMEKLKIINYYEWIILGNNSRL